MPTRKQLALVHVAKKQLGLDDAAYRAALERAAGVRSARDLDGPGLDAAMAEFTRLGFRQKPGRPDGPDYGERWGFATPAQVRLIRDLWNEYTKGEGTELSLGKWLNRTYGCSALRFLTSADAPKAITALMEMARRRKDTPPDG